MNTKNFSIIWHSWYLDQLWYPLSEEDKIQADLENITCRQYAFNQWMARLDQIGDGFKTDHKDMGLPVKLTWWKCWFWWLIPAYFLGTDDIKFRGWSIGHCLNCNANPYDGQVEAWSYNGNWFRGALIRCNKCGQLRWQPGESGRDY